MVGYLQWQFALPNSGKLKHWEILNNPLLEDVKRQNIEHQIINMKYPANPGKARDCSPNTVFVIYSLGR